MTAILVIQDSVFSVQYSVQKFCGAKLLLFADMCNTYLWGFYKKQESGLAAAPSEKMK